MRFAAQTGRLYGLPSEPRFAWNAQDLRPSAASPREAAKALWNDMQRAGFRFSELQGHLDDLAAGDELCAENGTAFRVINLTAGA